MAHYEATTEDNKCPFCEIVAGRMETPGVFWEDEIFMAFLSIDPNTEGFSCVIPKDHYGSDIMKMDDDTLQSFILAAKHVAGILEKAFDDVGRVGLIMEGTGIDHAHIKLSPMHGTEDLGKGIWKQYLSEEEFWFDTYEGWISSGGGPSANSKDLITLRDNLIDSQK
ncbi:MAG: histidine triad (HIT) family protein [Candidatus Paceibacteria bacterium]|jgi:diadenosine tetraphosphate (Ap4A) HIT family hydrolase